MPESVLPTVLFLGAALLVGYASHMVFRRHQVSDIIFLLLVGVIAGPLLGAVSPDVIGAAIPILAPIALVIVLFEGGLELSWEGMLKHATRALRMSLVTWALTTVAVALVMHYALGFPVILAVLFGVCVAATGMLVVIPLLAHMKVGDDARVVLTVETSVGDLLSAVVVTTISGMLVLGTSPWAGAGVLGAKFLVGGAVGLLVGVVWGRALHHLPHETHGYPLTLGALLLAYAATEILGGSGFIMALVCGLVLGNAASLVRLGGLVDLRPLPAAMRTHQGEIIFLLRSVYFVFLGLSVPPSILTPTFFLAGIGLVVAMVAARVVAVMLTMNGTPMKTKVLLVSMMPRGLATAVIAGIPASMGVPGTEVFLAYTFLVIVVCDLATSAGLLVHGRWRIRREEPASAVAH